jgi:hypothetical protein
MIARAPEHGGAKHPELLEDRLIDSPLVRQLRIELESIASSPLRHPVLAGVA